MSHDTLNGNVDVHLLGDPLTDVKLLGKAAVSNYARAFRHLGRYEASGLLGAFMFRV